MHQKNMPERILGRKEMNPRNKIPDQTQISASHVHQFPSISRWVVLQAVCLVFLSPVPLQFQHISIHVSISDLSETLCLEVLPQAWTNAACLTERWVWRGSLQNLDTALNSTHGESSNLTRTTEKELVFCPIFHWALAPLIKPVFVNRQAVIR